MADVERIKREIAEIAGRPHAVRFAEIDRIVSQLATLGYEVDKRRISDGWLFSVDGYRFSVVTHNRGRSQIKAVYVKAFLVAMMELALYE